MNWQRLCKSSWWRDITLALIIGAVLAVAAVLAHSYLILH